MFTTYVFSFSDYSAFSFGKFKVKLTIFPAIGGMMASDHTALHHTVHEDETSGQCRKRGSSNDSPGRLSKSTNNSQDSSCSKHSSKSGSAQFNHSNDFNANASRTAVNGSENSICSEENICGTSRNYYYDDFHSDASETSISEESGSYIIPLPQKPKTKEQNLPEKKKKNDVHTKGKKAIAHFEHYCIRCGW